MAIHLNIFHQTFRLCLVFLLAGSALLLVFSTHVSALTEYQAKQITDHLNHSNMKEDPSIFDGTQFVPGVSADKAGAYFKGYMDKLQRATRGWNMLSSSARRGEDAKALYTILKKKMDWGNAMKAAYPTFQASQSAPSAPGQAITPPAAQSGGLTDYQKQMVTKHLQQQDPTIFDGKNFVAGVPFPQISTYYKSYHDGLNTATNHWNKNIPSSGKNSPDGQTLFNQLKSAQQWEQAMQSKIGPLEKQYQAQQQAKQQSQRHARQQRQAKGAAHKQVCREFLDKAMLPQNRDPMTRLIRQQLHGNQAIADAEQVKHHQQVAQQVLSVCNSVDYQTLVSQACYYAIGGPEKDPQNWCEAAKGADPLIAAAALGHAKRSIQVVGSSTIQTPDQFIKDDGWLHFEGPVTFQEKLFFGSHGRETQMKNTNTLLAAAGVKDAETALWGEQKTMVDVLRQEVKKTAGTWTTPEAKLQNYSSDLVKKQILKWHPKASVHQAFISRESWKIHKNALGVTLRRTMPGYVFFKLPEDPLCQLRSYTLTEQYVGAGKFQKAKGVRLGYVRFQKCS